MGNVTDKEVNVQELSILLCHFTLKFTLTGKLTVNSLGIFCIIGFVGDVFG